MNLPQNPNFTCFSDESFMNHPFMNNFDFSDLMFDEAVMHEGDFNISDLMFDEAVIHMDSLIEEEISSPTSIVSSETFTGESGGSSNTTMISIKESTNRVIKEGSMKKISHRVAFRTKSKIDVMDDGFKWRKYGKKTVKNNTNKRNYYKCSSEGCVVKKRIERDRDDAAYVITTYEGVHNHESPSHVYYNDMVLSSDHHDDCNHHSLLQSNPNLSSYLR